MQLSSERKRAEEKEKRCNVPDVTFVDAEISKIFRGDVAENIRQTDLLENAEEEAKKEGLGLWGACE